MLRLQSNKEGYWEITQIPQAEAAFIATEYNTGAIKAMVGGYDFALNKFNHVTQAWRQPGSSFKPFIYSAAIEKGFSPQTVINDAPIVLDPSETGFKKWNRRTSPASSAADHDEGRIEEIAKPRFNSNSSGDHASLCSGLHPAFRL